MKATIKKILFKLIFKRKVLHHCKIAFVISSIICCTKYWSLCWNGLQVHCLRCKVISWAKLLCMFSVDYHHLKWEYFTIKQYETGKQKSSTKGRCEGFFLNYFSLLNNSPSYLMNSVQLVDCWRANDKFSWNNCYFIIFYYCKRIFMWQKN